MVRFSQGRPLGSKIDIGEHAEIAKGGLIVGDGSGAPVVRTVGANDEVLTAASGEADGVKWADAAGGAKVATGTYTGDGTTDQNITGIGFQPDVVFINADVLASGLEFFYVTSNFDVGESENWGGGNNQIIADKIISLDADGFSVDDAAGDAAPNKNNEVYFYFALKDG